MTTKINKGIPYKMNGPNPAKFSNWILTCLYDSDFLPKLCTLLLLQYGKVQAGWDLESDFLQNDPRNQAYMGLETGHVMGEIATGIHT